MEDTICMIDHTLHICALAREKSFEQIRHLIQNPQYLCANCGRAADKAENLCNP